MRLEANQDNLDDGYACITLIKEADDATFYEEGDAIAIGRPDIKGATEFLCRKGGGAWAGRCEALSLNETPSVDGDTVSFILQPGYVNALDPAAYTVYLVSPDGQQKLETRSYLDFIPADLPPSALQIIDSNDVEAKRKQKEQEEQRQREEAEEQKRLQAIADSQRVAAQAASQTKEEEPAPQVKKEEALPHLSQSPATETKKKKPLALLLALLLLLGGAAAGGGYYYYHTQQKEKELAEQQAQENPPQEVFEEEQPSRQEQQPQADQKQEPQTEPDQKQEPQIEPEQKQEPQAEPEQKQEPQVSPEQNQQQADADAARLEAERKAADAKVQEMLHRGNAKGRVADFFKGSRSPEAAMSLANELDAETSEQQDALFRLYYYAADQENPQGALRYAQCLDPSKPAWGTVKKDAVEAYYYYGKTPEGEAERTRLKEWTKNEAAQGNAQARKWLREMK